MQVQELGPWVMALGFGFSVALQAEASSAQLPTYDPETAFAIFRPRKTHLSSIAFGVLESPIQRGAFCALLLLPHDANLGGT